MKMVVADFLLCLLDCFILSLDSSGEAAREDDTNELDESYSNANTSNSRDVFNDQSLELSKTASSVDHLLGLVLGFLEDSLSTSRNVSVTARVGDISVGAESRVGPVTVLLSSAAFQLVLHDVPCFSDPFISIHVEVNLALLHVCLNDASDVRSEHVCCDSGSKLKEEDEGEEDGKGDGHTVVFLDGAAAAEECHEEDDAPDDDQENGSVEKLIPQEVEILAIDSLNNAASHDQGQAR